MLARQLCPVVGDRRLTVFGHIRCQKAHQHMMSFKHLLKCLLAPHQFLIGGESQEDHEAAGCMVFSRTYSSLHKRPGQRLMIVKDGECNDPLPTTCSDDDNDGITLVNWSSVELTSKVTIGINNDWSSFACRVNVIFCLLMTASNGLGRLQ